MSEELIVEHCSPTLAGIKTGSLFTCAYDSSEELQRFIRMLNRRLVPKGLRILILRRSESRVLLYLFRPHNLQRDMSDRLARSLLRAYGYPCESPNRCVVHLIQRLRQSEGFPHEIGLFLGYPSQDVDGFIKNEAKCAKCTGCWKVYGDEKRARETFDKYKKCRAVYLKQFYAGKSIERLTVAV